MGDVLIVKQGLTDKPTTASTTLTKPASDIQKLRELHVEMDNAVAAAYGWTDLDLGHGFHETKQGIRYTISEPARREVLQRLLKLNHERYAEEEKQGLHEKKKPKKPSSGRGRKSSASTEGPTLFGNDDDEPDPADDSGEEETTALKARTQRSAPRASRGGRYRAVEPPDAH